MVITSKYGVKDVVLLPNFLIIADSDSRYVKIEKEFPCFKNDDCVIITKTSEEILNLHSSVMFDRVWIDKEIYNDDIKKSIEPFLRLGKQTTINIVDDKIEESENTTQKIVENDNTEEEKTKNDD